MALNGKIFKAYDIRGKVGTDLNKETVELIARAFADWLPTEGAVAVGRDMRPDSAELARAAVEGLSRQGRDVIDIGEVTSDMIYFATGSLKLAGGVMITASHNPGQDNGIKLCAEGAKAVGAESGLLEVRDLAMAEKFKDVSQAGTATDKDIVEDWVQHTLSFIDADKLKPMKIAVDAGNGMAGAIFPELEPYVPWEVTEMYFELDGTFPNHEANPLKFETLKDLIAKIKEQGLDGGIAFDGDGDRAFLVDETGEVLTGGVMSAMMSEYFLDKYPGANIVYDVRNSRTVPEVIKESGGVPIRERVGHAYLKQAMRKSDAPFGGEASGHFYFRDNWYADSGLIGAVIGLYVQSLSGKTLSELRKHYTRYAAIPETNFEVADKEAMIKKISETFKDGEQDTLDGLSVSYDNGWFNVRPSNTEPLLRLNAEFKTQARLDEVVNKVKSLIQA